MLIRFEQKCYAMVHKEIHSAGEKATERKTRRARFKIHLICILTSLLSQNMYDLLAVPRSGLYYKDIMLANLLPNYWFEFPVRRDSCLQPLNNWVPIPFEEKNGAERNLMHG